jgi:hypothetical protein
MQEDQRRRFKPETKDGMPAPMLIRDEVNFGCFKEALHKRFGV